MTDSYWSGLAVADGTVLTTANVNATGNTDATGSNTVSYQSSGSPTITFSRPALPAGPGINITAAASTVSRFDLAHIAAAAHAVQIIYTPSAAPTTSDEQLITSRTTASGFAGYCLATTAGTLSFRNATNATFTGSTTPSLVNGHSYQIDMIVALNSGTPSSTNGRIIARVKDLTDSSWNSGAEFFVDSGYAINVGTDQHNLWRVGKAQSATVQPQMYVTGIKWGDRTALSTSTDATVARTQFIQPQGPSVATTGTGATYLISAVGTAIVGGSLTSSISQTAGTSATPVVIAPGVWSVAQDSGATRTYQVTVIESGGGSTVNTFVVPAATTATAGQYFRQKMISGSLV